jgi:hypothetical protein
MIAFLASSDDLVATAHAVEQRGRRSAAIPADVTSATDVSHLMETVQQRFGGLGGAVAEVPAELGVGRQRRIGVRDTFCTQVELYQELLRIVGIDAAGIEAGARGLLN